MQNLFSFVGMAFILFVVALLFVETPPPPNRYIETLASWPPETGKVFADLELVDQDGQKFKLSDLRGKVILMQFVGMNDPVSQAFSGAAKIGAFQKVPLQEKVPEIREFFPKYTALPFPNPDVVFLQVLFYDLRFKPPKPKDAKMWAEHFGFKKSDNQIVAIVPHDMRNGYVFSLIPGYVLIDKGFILRANAAGSNPQDDLFKTLLPMVPIAIKEEKR
jgi:hypothetical protein